MDNSLHTILEILERINVKKVTVVGDILLDEYVYGKVSKVSTGIKIPIIEKEKSEFRLGGAANIAANIAGLCSNITLIGRHGSDDAGNIVFKICKEKGIKLINLKSKKTTLKQRIYIDNQQISRIDTTCYTEDVSEKLDEIILDLKTNIIVVADYLYGTISQSVIRILSDFSKKNKIPLLVTSRDLARLKIENISIVVSSQNEWNTFTEKQKNYKIRKDMEIFITMGEKGIKYISSNYLAEKETVIKYPVNVSGAGDTVMAVISLLYGEEIDIDKILTMANIAGGLAVSDELTYVIRKCELIDALYEHLVEIDSRYKIIDLSLAKNIVQVWKEQDKEIVFTNGCYDLLHLGHIKSFQYAKQFGNKLVVAVNSDMSVKRIKGNGRPINRLEERIETLSHLEMIDMVIVFDEDTAINIIKNIEPSIYIKGEEYRNRLLPEAEYVKKIEYVPMIEEISTTQIIRKIAEIGEIHE